MFTPAWTWPWFTRQVLMHDRRAAFGTPGGLLIGGLGHEAFATIGFASQRERRMSFGKRLQPLRDAIALLREWDRGNIETANEVARPYQQDPSGGPAFLSEIVGLAADMAKRCAESKDSSLGELFDELVQALVEKAPDREECFRDAANLVTAVAQGEKLRADQVAQQYRDAARFGELFKATVNIATAVGRCEAGASGTSYQEVLKEMALSLAGEDEDEL